MRRTECYRGRYDSIPLTFIYSKVYFKFNDLFVLTVEKEEIKVTTHGLLYRLNSVDVILTTPRTQSQEKALENVEQFFEKLLDLAKTDRQLAIHICQSYLSACTSDQFRSEPVDEKFLKLIVECAVDDQKKVRKKLENLFSSLTKLENS